ncbi:2-succinyl-5-enolpyruvyl-6-hydroxy-3-cyclohexene-1- carboxylic-acid synthase [Rubidibacter lacunae KORDI 51-2]|uniref:2-succinyl-5-enolpyruvyl-6-hydroxy-3-cyclohexene-1-carboxylate synthase n=1 Tax=Rubidibacter lacunae KORDI 51-2 TaxID=582515 RepID=U5DJK4_9CHRO|nr:2-succinyl-5-enolpyruvyl-6-hydroxy-3-cyclohexene-1-carboxylic-acid synthase [Rubidibacter lacunae]ERN39870.1 2-succinyl-5-enolpyruvyl-6-hydroxy-3-cyclohexene-1- carboxylic-acid synthase [Rubidibacter lacunae KORDI 51-2]
MTIDFRNANALWSSVLVEALVRSGVATVVVCPGSRSGPLAVACARHPHIEAIPVLDERSAAFFALGIAKRMGKPVGLICTSGTAAANFYPVIAEAHESRVPLLVLSADRPPELRDCRAGQAIDQVKLYGTYPNWYAELALPFASLDMLRYLRQTAVQAVRQCLQPHPGPVHLNVPLRDPLAPVSEPLPAELEGALVNFCDEIVPPQRLEPNASLPFSVWEQVERGIILAGVAQPSEPELYARAIAALAVALGWPVLAEGLSPVRNRAGLNPYLVAGYDAILRDRMLARSLAPRQIIQFGTLPTSKELRAWLAAADAQCWILDARYDNLDPLHGRTTHLAHAPQLLARSPALAARSPRPPSSYLRQWLVAEQRVQTAMARTLSDLDAPFAGKIAWLLAQLLPQETPIIVANSTPVRDVEWFWPPGDRRMHMFCNRGANGIDGTLATALGIAHRQQSSVLLTGDLALLHDTTGFLLRDRFVGHLTIVLVNNNGGGIFEQLPIAQFDPPFEEFFATPQSANFAKLCAAYGVEHCHVRDWSHFEDLLTPLPTDGIRLLEFHSDRRADARWRQQLLAKFYSQ